MGQPTGCLEPFRFTFMTYNVLADTLVCQCGLCTGPLAPAAVSVFVQDSPASPAPLRATASLTHHSWLSNPNACILRAPMHAFFAGHRLSVGWYGGLATLLGLLL